MAETTITVWQKIETLCLIKLLGELKNCDTTKFNNEKFIRVSNKLFEHGFKRSHVECKQKWKELVSEYNNFKAGQSSFVAPEFYSELDKIISEVPDSSTEFFYQNDTPWISSEVNSLLKIMKQENYINILRNSDSFEVYENLAKRLQELGHPLRSKEDIKKRWNLLKNYYINYIKGELLHFKYFDSMDSLLDWDPHVVSFKGDKFIKDDHIESHQNMDDYDIRDTPARKKANNWSHKETDKLLSVIMKYDYTKIKKDDITIMFDEASMQLRLQGFKRSGDQCRVRFKHMKTKYFNALKKLSDGSNPENNCTHFNEMHQIINGSEEYKEQDTEDSSKEDAEIYEIEYLEDNQDDLHLFEKVFIEEQLNRSGHDYKRGNRVIWTYNETKYFLNVLKNKNIKRYCRRSVFEEVSQEMANAGYNRPAHMCMVKLKNLRNQFNKCLKSMLEGNEELCPFYDELCEINQKSFAPLDISTLSDQDLTEYDSEEGNFECHPQKIIQPENSETASSRSTLSNKKLPVSSSNKDDDYDYILEPDSKKCKTTIDGNEEDAFACHFKLDDVEHYCMSLASTIKGLPKEKTS